MAGHSKWANIQHRKGAQDAKRGKLFTKFIREITVSARIGGGDANSNPRLRAVMDKALSANMQKDTIERAIKRGCGALDADNYEEIRYEGYGPNGVAVMVECMTDNRNRTVAEVRHAFNKAGGNLGTDGSVAYLFKKLGVLSYPASCNEDDLVEAALEAGAQDIVTNDDGSFDVLTSPDDFLDVRTALEKANLKPEEADIMQRPDTYVSLDLDDAQKMLRLQDVLEDLDDVQEVHSNADISEEVLAQLG
ncbi:MAG: YebC/PmpR family DNA-binding transcriptional regulator [Thiotrichaceae bacterium]|nr:YebC/PmpR family DNA-binding transcriptional regulator [Thiotrichaceae bacterium]